jgi:diguanylate cyclase (GGDEF)-like protein
MDRSIVMPNHMPAGSAAVPVTSILITQFPGRRNDPTGVPWRNCVRAAHIGLVVVMAVVITVVIAVAAGARIRSLRDALRRERHDARHDRLTGLPNRRVVEDLLRSQPGPAVVGLVDLDHFKAVNDHCGHAAGDKLLQVIAGRLAVAMAGRGQAARLAGDEFVLLWDHYPADLSAVAAALLHALGQPVSVAGERHHPAASLGLAVRTPALTGTDLLAAADAAMYTAKRNRTGVHIFAPEPTTSALSDEQGTEADADAGDQTAGAGAVADTCSRGLGEPTRDTEIRHEIRDEIRDEIGHEVCPRAPVPDNHGRRGRRATAGRAGRRRNDP